MAVEKQKSVAVEITFTDAIESITSQPAGGWGENGVKSTIIGKAAQIIIRHNNESQFGIRIFEDGSIILQQYDARFTMSAEAQMRLEAVRKWK